MCSWFSKVGWLELIDLNNLNQKEDCRYCHANNVANDDSKWVISIEFVFIFVGNILVPKHLDKEWNDVAGIEHEKPLEIPSGIIEQRVNNFL
mgnify:CR=1 FL=1